MTSFRCVSVLVLIGLLSACGDSADTAVSTAASTSSSNVGTVSPGTLTATSSSSTKTGSATTAPISTAAATGTTTTAPASTTTTGTTATVPTTSSKTTSATTTAPSSTSTTTGGTTTAPVGTTSTTSTPTSIAFSTNSATVLQRAGSVTVTVTRSGSSGAASVSYATRNGTAMAGQNFTAQSGTLTWANGDATVRNIVVPVSAANIGKAINFSVTLSNPTGAFVGTPASTMVTINPSATNTAAISVSVSGNKLIDAQGSEIQLRGVNVSGLEGVAIQGWSPSNPWGSQTGTATPDWNTMKTWDVNVVRLPLNEASWLGLSCIDEGGYGSTVTNGARTQNRRGTMIKADPGSNYQATVASSVAGATAAGFYVILDLHWAAPGNICPTLQNAMADADHSVDFWTSVANAFKSSPNVIFELFNEPFLDMTQALVGNTPGPDLLNGATLTSVAAAAPGNSITVSHTWQSAGMQQLLDAVRATGATNVVLTSTNSYAGAPYEWLQYKPTDPAKQLAAVWHAYRTSPQDMSAAKAIKAAGYPVIITEYGDQIGGSAPDSSTVLPFADANDISYLGWTWDVWPGDNSFVLITDAAGNPSPGYGTYVKAHYICRASGSTACK